MKNIDINGPVQKLRFDEAMTGARVDPAAGKLLDAARLIRPTDLVDAYYAEVPDPSQALQRVHFGTSGHRGSALRASFNEPHIIAIAQSICLYRKRQGIDGPLFLGIDTHALSRPAFETALEVFVANDVVTMIDGDDGYTPTPVISHAILTYNRGRTKGLADGVVLTPSHNPQKMVGSSTTRRREAPAALQSRIGSRGPRTGYLKPEFANADAPRTSAQDVRPIRVATTICATTSAILLA